MIQKHFLVRCMDQEKHFRHYTACNAMHPETYNEYIRCLKQDSGESFNSKLLSYEDKNFQMLTIKDYGRGLSTRVHNAQPNTQFEIKGPIGKGLEVSKTGVHIAFAAGTGALCFVDLVATLIMSTLNIKPPQTDAKTQEENEELMVGDVPIDQRETRASMLDGTFKLYLYVSFPKRSEAIALELFEALAEHCNRLGKNCFDLHIRLSAEG